MYSPLIPSLFSQGFSKLRDAVTEADKKLVFDKVVDQLYEAKVFDEQSVCTQWPEVCSKTDGQFLDGYYTDQCSLALNIGQYQSQNSDNIFTNTWARQGEEEPLKVILTDTNQFSDDDQALLPYFNSPINKGIAPGEYMWPADLFLPLMSPQIFDFKLDSASLTRITKPIPGSNVTVTRVLATTVDNPRFHVKAGQRVDLLILRLNSNISTSVIGTEAIQALKGPLAEMAQGIAASAELLNAIKEFMNAPITAFPTGAPTESDETAAPSLDRAPDACPNMPARSGLAKEDDQCCAVRVDFMNPDRSQFPQNQYPDNNWGCDNGPDSRDLNCIIQNPYPENGGPNGHCIRMDTTDISQYVEEYPKANN